MNAEMYELGFLIKKSRVWLHLLKGGIFSDSINEHKIEKSWVWLHLLKGGIFSKVKKACKKKKIEKKERSKGRSIFNTNLETLKE